MQQIYLNNLGLSFLSLVSTLQYTYRAFAHHVLKHFLSIIAFVFKFMKFVEQRSTFIAEVLGTTIFICYLKLKKILLRKNIFIYQQGYSESSWQGYRSNQYLNVFKICHLKLYESSEARENYKSITYF